MVYALDCVRRCGGALEHPFGSSLSPGARAAAKRAAFRAWFS